MDARNLKFFSYFPPPLFLTLPFAGMEISDEAIRLIKLSPKKNGYNIDEYIEHFIPKGLIENGFILEENLVIAELKKIKAQVRSKLIKIALPEEKMYLFKTEISADNEIAARSAIEFKLEENIPIPPREVIFEFEPIDKKGGQYKKVSVFAFPQKAIETYLSVCTLAGFTVQGFETQPKALSKVLISPSSAGETVIIVNISEQKTGIFIVSKGVPIFSSTISVGGESITSSISKAFSITIEEARKMKYSDLFIETNKTKDLFSATINIMSSLKDEILKVKTYWDTHGEGGIAKIYLVGHDSQMSGFVDYLETNLKTDVMIGDVWSQIIPSTDGIPPIEFGPSLDFAVSLGAAMMDIKTHD